MAEQSEERSDRSGDRVRAPGWGFLVRWVLVTVGGWAAVGVMGGGVLGGVFQSLVLRRYVGWSGWWAGASVVGWVMGVGLGAGFDIGESESGNAIAWFVDGGVLGVLYVVVGGVLQWFVLRQMLVQTGWWLAATVVGGVVGGGVSVGVGWLIGGIVGGAVYGAATGLALMRLLRDGVANSHEATAGDK